MGTEENKQVVRNFLERFSRGEMEEAFELMDDSASYWIDGDLPISGTHTKAEFMEAVEGLDEVFEDWIEITPKAFTAEGNRVAVEAESYGPMKDGKVYENRYHLVYEVEDGKIQSVREYVDTKYASEVLFGGG